MGQQEARIDKVISAAIVEIVDVERAEVHMSNLFTLRVLLRKSQLDAVQIDPGDHTRGTHKTCHRQCDMAATTANIQTSHATPDAGAFE